MGLSLFFQYRQKPLKNAYNHFEETFLQCFQIMNLHLVPPFLKTANVGDARSRRNLDM